MKTVQHYLKEANANELVNLYMTKYPATIQDIPDADARMSVRYIREDLRERLHAYIQRLVNLDILPVGDGKTRILLAHECLAMTGNPTALSMETMAFSMITAEELAESSDVIDAWSYSYMRQAEIMGFYVSDTEFTQAHMTELLLNVLYEASTYGFKEEYFEEMSEALLSGEAGYEEGREMHSDDYLPSKERDCATSLAQSVENAITEYNRFFYERELSELRGFLERAEQEQER